MHTQPLSIPGLLLCSPKVFGDDRGFFYESFNQRAFDEAVGSPTQFVQDNHSRSSKGVLRGLHYQLQPSTQGKLVRVVRGAVFDVAVDIRRGSPTFGKWEGVELSEQNRKQLWIPPGFAHGFLALCDETEMLYKATAFYNPAAERSIMWNDSQVGVVWSLQGEPILAAKDAAGQRLSEVTPLDCGMPIL